ncbi:MULTISPECIES: 50S ribosomal protein L3 [Exiguobacterium]|uniref:Large ribosomal subunit protein uL3 n=1 Tax=Exiguobacterium sibiricum (strain DSM 17290 / CCUG 55495 / CIP 109462 / JCM 13490 / 255-15) TaxID=262543 RepID=RL3_EXIS2|nr:MULTISPECIES: 50S ribosomal protein L3 [Exiguobacterium]B1YGV0.1 RecName: Full=Large ribosomal subunit protein uL3; AltName: Full=50S ribosomal protein L3 [Exiguobacterium sibiricum 255-15]ACB59583.1 ribosomal protein L3 [Exiguobacterium sibiricum 255-15]MCK2158986.1 50S ribosomal protein L3 [Exiguobacterium sp. 17-1]MCT4791176.1 50S ribosomal protein L3 [Exiguobacterium artemiae]MDW2886820.1 50S ribosomal protein L3 [Exiguobacterium sibiricum]MDX1261062.1 50S ribosomal protein L3 [Exiguob
MAKGILGTKLGMTQIFNESGEVVPVTVVSVEGNVVLQLKTMEVDGYEAVQLGFGDIKEGRQNKPQKGHAAKASATPKRFIKEIRTSVTDFEIGQEIKADTFAAGEMVDVTGTSKGKGFAGAIKRHNQSRGPMAHGSRYHRRPGSMGPVAPNRVFKGKLLPGRMGGEQVTVQNLEIVKVDVERGLLLVKGAIPGARKSQVVVKTAVKGN